LSDSICIENDIEKSSQPTIFHDESLAKLTGLFGLGYAGFLQHFLYTRLWPLILQVGSVSVVKPNGFMLRRSGFFTRIT
jgi:hypothetical protein